jgi:general secretion pathway protein K
MRRRPKRTPSGERGFALLLVLVALALASVLALSIAADTRTGIALARSRLDSARAEALADAGVHAAVFRLLGALDADAGPIERRYRLSLGDGEITIEVEDEDGKIDLNFASPELLARLVQAAGLDGDAASALIEQLLRRRGDEEPDGSAPLAAGTAAPVVAGLLSSVVELRQVPGVSQALFERLEPAVTVTAESDGFDPAVAPLLAVRALPDITPETAARLMAGEPAFEIEGLAEAEPFILETRQGIYTIRAHARTSAGASFVRIALIELNYAPDEPFIVHDWRQGATAPSPAAGR